jgi:hypothetical protein
LRVFARKDHAGKPMIGFGDPVFDPAERAKALAAQRRAEGRVAVATRAYNEFWQGASLDRTMLSKALPSLLDTADALKAVAAKLGAPASTSTRSACRATGRSRPSRSGAPPPAVLHRRDALL